MKEPDWISISCNKKIINIVICRKNEKKYNFAESEAAEFTFCNYSTLLMNDKCYGFLWGTIEGPSDQFCSAFEAKGISADQLIYFKHIFNAVSSVNTFPVLIMQNNFNVQVVKIQKLFGKLRFINISPENFADNGTHICAFNKLKINIGINIFQCKKGGYILHTYVYDGIKDCPNDNSDEKFCICSEETISAKINNFCMKMQIRQNKSYCTSNYYMTVEGICEKYDFKTIPHRNKLTTFGENKSGKKFTCNNGDLLDNSLLNDLFSDCKPESEDEPILLSLKTTNLTFHCEPWKIPCMEGHIVCFNFTDICLYKLNEENNIVPCRMGGHLENCAKFECNKMFKCPDSYCVPWSYVCDGKWDCPFGEDELNNTVCGGETACEKMYRCRNQQHRCISIGNVCDNEVDCPYRDDESFCELKLIQCPEPCNCLIFAITCFQLSYNMSLLDHSNTYLAVSIFDSKLISLRIFEHRFQSIKFIKMPNNSIILLCPVQFLMNLVLLDISDNFIDEIKQKCFSLSNLLKCINLSKNQIVSLSTYAFQNLYHLRFLNLSSNPLTNLPSKCFSSVTDLKVLNLKNVKFMSVEPNSFMSTYVKIIINKDYKISCISPDNSICTSYPPWFVSCSDTLPGVVIKAIFMIISIFTICLNMLSILLALLNRDKIQHFQIIVIALNFSDMLCGIYLAWIAVSDILFKGIYLINENLWKSHPLCLTGICIILWFTTSSQIMLLYSSVSRLRAVIDPIKSGGKSQKVIFYQVCIIHLFSICLSFFLTFVLQFSEKQLPTSLCSPFIDPSNSSVFTKVISWIVIITQSIVSLTIVMMHTLLIKEVNKSKGVLKKDKFDADKMMMTQLLLTSTSNILCWFPTNSVYISAMFLSIYPVTLVIWTTVVVMPINSIINPCVFIGTHFKTFIKGRIKRSEHNYPK